MKLTMLDSNSLNAIAGLLRHKECYSAAETLLSIQRKINSIIDSGDNSFAFSKTVNVTNLRNVLVQIPKAVVMDWGLQKGDTLELIYEDNEITIRPHIQGRGNSIKESN